MALPIDLNGKGLLANRPAAASQLAGVRYWAMDGTEPGLYRCNGTTWELEPATFYDDVTVVIDGNGAAITTGVKADRLFDYDCTIVAVTLLADQPGSIVIDIWKDSYANYPPTVADTITASAKPTLASAIKSQDTTLTGWTATLSAGDVLRFNVDSASTVQRVTLVLKVRR